MRNLAKSVHSAFFQFVRPSLQSTPLKLRIEPELGYLALTPKTALFRPGPLPKPGVIAMVHPSAHLEEEVIAGLVHGRVGGSDLPAWADGTEGAPRHGVCLSRVEGVVHTPEYGAVITRDGAVLKSSIGEALYFTPDLLTLPGVSGEADGAVMTVAPDTRRLSSASVFMAWGGRFNYGHFLLDCLSALCVMANEGLLRRYPPVAPPLSPWHRDLLDLFLEPNEPRVIELNDAVVRVGDAVSATPMDHFLHAPGPPLDEVRRRILSRVDRPGMGPERIYLSRRHDEKRRLSNEIELERALESRGFSVVQAQDLSVREQVALFNSARVIVGPTGAAFANCLFCEAGAEVFEIQPTNYMGIWVRGLCHFVQAHWNGYFAPSPSKPKGRKKETLNGVMFEWVVPLDDFLKFLDDRLSQ